MKVIDAEFEIAHYTSMTTHPTPDVTEQDKRNSLIILNALRMAKSVDICFCRDCKHWRTKYFKDGHGWCEWHINETKADDFCSYGSSSEKANNCEVSEKPTGSERSSE